MNTHISKVFSKFNRLAWLVLPTLVLFIAVYFIHKTQHSQLNTLLLNMNWLIYVCIGLSSVIAMLFKQSRLVYSCLILLLLVPATGPFLGTDLGYDGIKLTFSLLTISYLILTRDKGFSPLNTLATLGILATLWIVTYFAVPQLNLVLQPGHPPLDRALLFLSQHFAVILKPLELIVITLTLLLGGIRLIWVTTNTHNSLFFCLLLIPFLHVSNDTQIKQLGVIFLAVLISYSVIKDSFTMAFKDELTTIPSRRALMQYVQTLGRKYTVVMSDIDHFKKFNDTYGHDVGDEVLKLVASKLNQVTGGGKTFRFGGEEFVIIFPRKNANEVVPFIEVVRQVIADYDIALRAKPRPAKPPKGVKAKPKKEKVVKVTTSFGIAQRTKEATDFNQVMKQADVALYAAKKAGRNCVKVAKQ